VLHHFEEVRTKAKEFGPVVISVAAAQDEEVLKAVKMAIDLGLAKAILVGDAGIIRSMIAKVGLPANTPIVHEPDVKQAALTATSLVSKGEAQVLVKGLVNSGDFLKAVVNREVGLRTGRTLCHLAVFEDPKGTKLLYHSDGGMNIAPDLAAKKDIITNCIMALTDLGIEQPKVAILAANEVVNPKMQATMDAKALVDLHESGELFPASIIEGPIAMDVALSPKAAQHKGLLSKIAGDVDLFIFPTIEAGNLTAKSLMHYANFKMAGIVLGTTHPVVMASRSDQAESKLNSIALACLLSGGAETANNKSPL
jgi:phosphate butyryltransferase